mgnify:FL=1
MSDSFEQKKGGISVDIEHLFPIIKKWLYSEKEIFLREIVSNASDAITKLARLSSLGQASDIDTDAFRIDVVLDPDEGTLSVTDNGIGMTEEEVSRYICQIALSGAVDFISKYEGEQNDQSGIIGHFGLGFYSAFMVSDRVDVYTRSYTGAPAVKWTCDGDGAYEITPANADQAPMRGTRVVMHISTDEEEFLKGYKIREVLQKYCAFMPYEIYFTDLSDKKETPKNDENASDTKKEAAQTSKEEGQETTQTPINDTHPLWQKKPSECTEDEYRDFYRKVFADYKEPLFHIHINADYPLNFRGILYFPRLNQHLDNMEGQIKLYYHQVFVADNIKELLPDHLTMLRGVLDCPELPLNVSRSYLQNSAYAAKIGQHISKKVADKLTGMFHTERENFEKLWPDLKTFVEYACLREPKFYDRIKGCVLYHTTEKETRTFVTLQEYLEEAKTTNENKVYYTTDPAAQAQYISLLRAQDIEVVIIDTVLESQFIQMIEQKNDGVQFIRVDADIAGALKADDAQTDKPDETESADKKESENKDSDGKDQTKADAYPALTSLFRDVSGKNDMEVRYIRLKDQSIPAMLTVDEQAHRMDEMMRMYQLQNGLQTGPTLQRAALSVNLNNKLIEKLQQAPDTPDAKTIASQIYHLALLSQRQLTPDELSAFLTESYNVLEHLQ